MLCDESRESNVAQQVRGHVAVSAAFPIQSGPLRRSPAWIFDNQVEHASRENKRSFGLIILTVLKVSQTFELCEAVLLYSTSVEGEDEQFQTRV
jgi:hypothetical protein